MKKLISALLTAVLFSMACSGCGGAPSASSSPASSTPATPASSAAPASSATEQTNWPTKTIEVINPSAAGGETDIYGRIFQKYMEKELGQTMVTVNMPGGGGTISTTEVSNSENDGYRMLVFHNGFLINNLMGLTELGIDNYEMAAIPIVDATQCFFVSKNAPYNNIKEMIDHVKAGNSVTIATEVGSFTHFQLLMLQQAAGVELDIVDSGTTPEKIAAILAGNIDVMGTNISTMRDYMETGDIKALCLLSPERNSQYPDIPTAKELGYDIDVTKFFFYAFPDGTDPAIVQKFNDAARKVAQSPEFIEEINALYAQVTEMTAAECVSYMQNIYNTYQALL
ncbi:MAG: tripartite tricarboxylate transporter substrate binding protein [Anaerotruncus sp.]|nr:tripartite tricarboxylate transporter substrate binding protein [Anaerotruncus sp.]